MNLNIKRCLYNDIENDIASNNLSLSSPIDSFAEEHILKSNHYCLLSENEKIGYFSIHGNKTITQFYIKDSHKKYGPPGFEKAKKTEYVSEALVPTCDEFFLSCALDSYRDLKIQAYFFKYGGNPLQNFQTRGTYRIAQARDLEIVKKFSGDFFDENVAEQIEQKEIYIGFDKDRVMAFGVFERGKILKDFVSIGMYTDPYYRMRGVGRQTISFLIGQALELGYSPIAGCWYYNHASKKTLESAGMVTQTKYLRISF